MKTIADQLTSNLSSGTSGLRVGVDIVRISDIAGSLASFGDRFVDRIYTPTEAAYARSGTTMAERLSARFAAKEAALKALDLCHEGVNLRDIEVVRDKSGSCALQFHGRAAEIVCAAGPMTLALSLSHDGDYAFAAVTVVRPFS